MQQNALILVLTWMVMASSLINQVHREKKIVRYDLMISIMYGMQNYRHLVPNPNVLVGSKTFLQQNPTVVNWVCQATS